MHEPTPIENFKKYPTFVESASRQENKVLFSCSEETLQLSVLSENVFRLRFSPDGFFERDFSYAIKPDFKSHDVSFDLEETKDEFLIETETVICNVAKAGMRISFSTKKGETIVEDDAGFHWEPNRSLNGNFIYCSKKIQEGEFFFGLGDKPTELNLRGKRLQNWSSDKYGYEKDEDPVYRDIPFYIGLHHGIAYGVFFDNSYKKFFDFGHEDPEISSFWADGGEMNYYFIFGPELINVVERYAWLTGTPALPPLWSLGYHQSKWSYYPESKVMEVAKEFRLRKIPCDAIHIDIDYMDGFRCFTWDKERFPNPEGMIAELGTMGIKAIPIIDPGIKIDKEYFVYQQGLEGDHFCKRSEGGLMKGEVWPGMCCFPDFTKPETRDWWGDLFQKLASQGIEGIWNDMNEPTVFGLVTFFDDVRHDYDGDNCSHRKAHNVYGMQMSRATFEGMKRQMDNKRPFCLTRSGYAGVQRFSAVWTGDNIASWEHLWLANIQCQRLSISGVSFVGSDVGGFIGEPNGPLLARWIQLGIFHPLLRSHSSGDRGDKEPWVFGDKVETIVRKYVELRYKLLPYIYTSFWQNSTKGTPIIRPLSFLDQSDPETYFRMDEFGFGDNLLICPISQAHETSRWMYLPKGGWYDFGDESFYEGGMEILTEAPLDTLPLFVKAGTVLPLYPVQQYVGEKKIEVLSLHVYHVDGILESVLYEDAGQGFGYQSGEFNHSIFEVKGTLNSLKIKKTTINKGYQADYKKYKIHLHGLPFNPNHAVVDGKMTTLTYTKRTYVFHFSSNADFEEIVII